MGLVLLLKSNKSSGLYDIYIVRKKLLLSENIIDFWRYIN